MKGVLLSILLLGSTLGSPAYSGDDSYQRASSYIDRALELKLYKLDPWLSLLQYRKKLDGGFESEVQSRTFFNSSTGRYDPKSELEATIERLFGSVNKEEVDTSARCKQLARFHWLDSYLKFPQEIKDMKCPRFENWIDLESIDSISLIFASGYFKNPASFYGHPLIKINSVGKSSLLDITINNGAIVPENENSILYILKGLFGGYQSAFSDTKFYQMNHNYTESDLRDTWEYELDLNNEQLKRVVYYGWELLGERFTYKFFSKNCSYFIENLMEYVLSKRISQRSAFYSIPSKTFFNLMDYDNDGKSLVKSIKRNPSRQNSFYDKFRSLSGVEKYKVKTIADSGLIGSELSELLPSQKLRIIDTLIDYLGYLEARSPEKGKKHVQLKYDLYLERLNIPIKNQTWNVLTESELPPHKGVKPSLVGVSYLNSEVFGSGLRFRLRPANYDLIDLDYGRVPHSTLNMFNLEFDYLDDKISLAKLDLVNIQTLGLSQTDIKDDASFSWQIRFGLDRPNFDCVDCAIPNFEGRLGKAFALGDIFVGYINYGVNFHSSFERGQFRHSLRAGLIGQYVDTIKTNFWIDANEYIDASDDLKHSFHWESRFSAGNAFQYRFLVSRERSLEYSLSLTYNW